MMSRKCLTAVHTGFWGCGAFGGNRQLMTLLQLIAACASGVDLLVFHTGFDGAACHEAVDMLEGVLPEAESVRVAELVSPIDAMGVEWGVSDGN